MLTASDIDRLRALEADWLRHPDAVRRLGFQAELLKHGENLLAAAEAMVKIKKATGGLSYNEFGRRCERILDEMEHAEHAVEEHFRPTEVKT